MEEIFVKSMKDEWGGIHYCFYEHGKLSKPLFMMSQIQARGIYERIGEQLVVTGAIEETPKEK